MSSRWSASRGTASLACSPLAKPGGGRHAAVLGLSVADARWGFWAVQLAGIRGGGASLLCVGYVAATRTVIRCPCSPWAAGCSNLPVGAAGKPVSGGRGANRGIRPVLRGDTGRIDAEHLVGGYLHYRYGWGTAFAVCACALGLCLLLLAFSWAKLAARERCGHGHRHDNPAAVGTPRRALRRAIVFFAGFSSNRQRSFSGLATCRMDLPEAVSTLNPVFAVAFLASPLAAWRDLRGRLTLGMLFLAAGFGVLLLGSSLRYLALWYLLATVGEVLISHWALIWLALWFRGVYQLSPPRSFCPPCLLVAGWLAN